ncbi:MAG: 3-phosphoshikimate 1-carboxyvinyltransferase [Actinomycetes bacterium]
MSEHWSAPFRGLKPVSASIVIPGSKSVTNRALILAALAKTPSILRKPLHSRDSQLMIAGLSALGTKIVSLPNGDLEITPAKFFGPAAIDVGNAGTVMRFLPPLAALTTGLVHFDGDPRSHERPLGPVITALEDLGISIEHGSRYSLPLTINGTGKVKGGLLEIDATSSSQFISALLLMGPATEEGITVTHVGTSLPSLPHIEMTIQMLRDFGAKVSVSDYRSTGIYQWRVEAGELHGLDLIIEPDLSNAAPFMAAAMICGGEVRISDWPKETTQPGDQLRKIFARMGAKIELVSDPSGNYLSIKGDGVIAGIDVDLHDVGELTPSIAALCALAETPSTLRGIGHLRLHETDRLAALAAEINALGGDVDEEESALHISPAPLHSGIFHSYEDHRLATAGAIIGLRIPGIEVENIATTKKTLPDFPGAWAQLLADGN